MQTPHINHQYLTKVCPTTHDPRWQKMSVRQSLRLTQQVTSIPHLLRWEDRNSMRWSIESRLPFLDYRLVELSRSIPTNMLMNEGETKVAFKEALGDILPPAIRERKDKIGFEVPEDELLRHPRMIEYLKSIIYSSSFRERPYWNWHEVERVF
jgi:asparagine synthase (glutamine-hydrolysing)